MQERYGKNNAGMRLLTARRLVEAGVRYVSVSVGGWDFHENIANRMRGAVPPLDKAYAALISDLDERGLLDTTLVLLTTEFGRTAKVNPRGGRDHWPSVFSTLLAGGGLKRGYVHGSSDSTGSEVESKAVTPEDIARTLYTLVGVDPDRQLLAGAGRPLSIISGGRVLRALMA